MDSVCNLAIGYLAIYSPTGNIPAGAHDDGNVTVTSDSHVNFIMMS